MTPEEKLQVINAILSDVDPDTAENPDVLEAYDWITAIQKVRAIIENR